MLSLFLIFLSILASAYAQSSHYLFGPSWGIRNSAKKGYILSLETTLHPNAPPKPARSRLAIWPGLDTANGLVQPVVVSSSEALFQGRGCGGATLDQWCVFASMYSAGKQKSGPRVPLSGNEALTAKFKYNETLDGYQQYLYIKGKLVSSLSVPSGKSNSFYVETECQSEHTGTVNNHTYTDTTVVLSEALPTWGKAPNLHYKGCADSVNTPDGGKTWKISAIRLQSSEAPKEYAKTTQRSGNPFCG